MQGRIIFLNGTSSSGKTTLAHALQEALSDHWLHVALDQFRDGMSSKFRGLNSPEGSSGKAGLNVVPVDSGDKVYTAIEFGDEGKKILRGMRRAIRSLVETGNNVIIDDIILENAFLQDYLQVFAGLEVTFVGVRCPLEVINDRETARPGRFPGTALGHMDICHAHDLYDVDVNTAEMNPAQCAQRVVEYLQKGCSTAFNQLRARN